MNGVTGCTASNGGIDKSKEWQMELLMEKLRSKAGQFKSFTETSKSVRMTILDKRYSLDSVEKNQHQKCLDTLQHCIKVTSLQSMVERLESLTRQLGLKFMVSPSGMELFISSDMFYLEIILDANGAVKDVKVHHEGKGEQQGCVELVNCLSRGDFADFTAQLEGLASIYQLNAEKKVKCKAFSALQSLEADLSTLAQLQTFIKEPFNLLHKSPVGILEKRRGGHAMKLTYFVSPYDLIDKEKGIAEPLSVETVTSKGLGYSVTVCMEGSTAHKLQTTTIISVNRNLNGKSTPSYAALNNQNSAMLPACFMLRLNKPLPMCVALVKCIQQVTEMECGDLSSTHPLMSLITQHISAGQLDCANNKGLFVTLPDQHHCYFMTENKNLEGILVTNIPFTHPAHVPQILVYLRQQALFNVVIASCIRPCSKQDLENMIMFEVSALSWQHITISLEHPVEESMATSELDLSDISNVTCTIHTPISSTPTVQSSFDSTSEIASKVFQRSLSIPITMRSVIKFWDEQVSRKHSLNGNENFSLPLGSGDPGGKNGPGGNSLTDFSGLDGKIKHEFNGGGGHMGGISHQQGMFINESTFPSYPSGESGLYNNIELGSILSNSSGSDKPSKRQHKRKSSDDMWKSVKRKQGDDDMLLDSSSSDSTSRSTPTSQDATDVGVDTPNSPPLGFHFDIDMDSGELTADKGSSDYDCSKDEELSELESTSKSEKRKLKDERKDSENKNLVVAPSVSITPVSATISQSFNNVLSGMGLEKRPGIEIIPIATSPATSLPSSITITPISSSQAKMMEGERSREKKASKSRSDDKNRLEKKRKRKREEGPMGPPDKVPLKQDPLSKPVSVSIKPAESPPLPQITPTSPSSIMRKFASSPVSGKSSPAMLKPIKPSPTSSHQSPKHSPGHISSSPKHVLPGISSPKNHGSSPKHPSAGSTGKPSMSTLKSATNSPSSKSSGEMKVKSIGKDLPRDKEKKSTFSVSTPKLKSSSVKLKQLDTVDLQSVLQQGDSLPSPSATIDLSKSSLNQMRNRKGSLSAVIDKLKSAQHAGEGDMGLSKSGGSGRDGRSGVSSKSSDTKIMKAGENKNSEYMVKPSSDGMKITINKTRSKESSKTSGASKPQSFSSGTGSPKTHTGLKPGVNSGPASKKPQQPNQKPLITNSAISPPYSIKTGAGKAPSQKSSSGLTKSVSKLGSPKSATDLSSRSKERLRLGKTDKSIFSKSERKSSPSSRDETDSERAFKMLAQHKMEPYPTLVVDGLIKSLDTNFQIPKLSARTSGSDESKKTNRVNAFPETGVNNIVRTVDTAKMFDMISKEMPKYPLALTTNTKPFENSVEAKNLRNSLTSLVNNTTLSSPLPSNPLSLTSTSKLNVKSEPSNLTMSEQNKEVKDDSKLGMNISKAYATTADTINLSMKNIDTLGKYSTQYKPEDRKTPVNVGNPSSQEAAEMLLDFSSSNPGNKTEHLAKMPDRGVPLVSHRTSSPSPLNITSSFPASPSVSVHIVKSPVQSSPTVNPSPHSISPCITDDELMDEALVGMGK